MMILFPPSGFPFWVAAPAHCEQRDSWEEFGGQECVDCAAVAICIGLCYLWLCIFAQKAPSHFLPTQVWLPLGFSSSLQAAISLQSIFHASYRVFLLTDSMRFHLSPFIHSTPMPWAPTEYHRLFKALGILRQMRCKYLPEKLEGWRGRLAGDLSHAGFWPL